MKSYTNDRMFHRFRVNIQIVATAHDESRAKEALKHDRVGSAFRLMADTIQRI